MLIAQRQFRAAWLRISENTRLLDRWRAGDITEGSREWMLGRVLDHVALTGDVPRTLLPGGQSTVTNHGLLGGCGAEKTWGRLFLTTGKLTALAVLMTDRFAWNLSVYDRLPTPTRGPSAGEKATVTYQVQVEKRRSGSGRWFSTENITDSGAASPGRLITQALAATAHARRLADSLEPGTDLLMACRTYRTEPKHTNLDRPAPVGPVSFGVSDYLGKWWGTKRELTVPSIPSQEPQNLLAEDDRWPLLQRCLTDDGLPTDVRAAGAITLLFGPSTERLCHLTPEQLKFGDKHAHLVLGRHPVLLPPRLAELLRHLAEQPQLRPQLSRVRPGPQWLFPGMVPGKPISTHGMTQKLNRHGIPVRTARNAALAALAADLPSPILADVTGMHRHTALRWVAYARRDWAEYLAARTDDDRQPRRNQKESS